jgi:exopolysaccharide biosynthesis polyprenyl glycosylphosphotransferase
VSINHNRRSALLLLGCDLLSVVVIFNLVTYARGVSLGFLVWPLLAPAVILVVSLHLIDGYGSNSDMMSLDYASLHLIAAFSALLVTVFLTFAFIPHGFELQTSRAAIFLSFGLLGPITLAYRRILYQRSAQSRGDRRIVFVGGTYDYEIFRMECERMGTRSALIHVDSSVDYEAFSQLLTTIGNDELRVEAIVIKESPRDFPDDMPMRLVQLYFSGVPTYTLEIFHQLYWRKIPLYRINPIWLFQEGFQIAREPVFERLKRLSDIVLSLLGLILALPLIALAAAAIKLEDRGPVFFAQTRIGRNKVPFRLLKLRTMRVAKGAGDPYTREGDRRITRTGRFLRSARLDEFPQLWNVLCGQMSLIGPRAEWDRLVAEYEKEIPSYHFRHLVKPGITGWAQVNYRYGSGVQDTLRKLEYDLYYIRNFSFMLDASIVLKTLHVMVRQKGV